MPACCWVIKNPCNESMVICGTSSLQNPFSLKKYRGSKLKPNPADEGLKRDKGKGKR
jgi:hypothetical protein